MYAFPASNAAAAERWQAGMPHSFVTNCHPVAEGDVTTLSNACCCHCSGPNSDVAPIQGLMALAKPAPKMTPASVIAEAEALAAAGRSPACSNQSGAAKQPAEPGQHASSKPRGPEADAATSKRATAAASDAPDAASRRLSADVEPSAANTVADPLQQLQQHIAQLAQMQQMREDQARQQQQQPAGVSSAQHAPGAAQQPQLEPAATAALAAVLSAAGVSHSAAVAAAQAAAAPASMAVQGTRGCSNEGHASGLAELLGDSSSRCASPTPDYLQQLFDQAMGEQPAPASTAQDSAGAATGMQHAAPDAAAAPDAGGWMPQPASTQQPPTPGPAGWGDLQGQQGAGRGRSRAGISRFGAEEERHKQQKVGCMLHSCGEHSSIGVPAVAWYRSAHKCMVTFMMCMLVSAADSQLGLFSR